MRAIAVVGLLLAAFSGAIAQAQPNRPSACRISQLALSRGPDVSEKTGPHTLAIRITNRGARSCVLDGYPAMALVDAHGLIPFTMKRGGDAMITSRAPRPVAVRPGRAAFALVNKYRCDLGDLRVARRIELGLGGNGVKRLVLRIPRGYDLAYCGKGDPGSTVHVSPFEPSVAAALTRGQR